MKAKVAAALLFFPIALIAAGPSAMAGYQCVAQNMRGDPTVRFDRVTATVLDRHRTYVEHLINLGVTDPKLYLRRSFVINYSVINYSNATDSPAIVTSVGFNFPVFVKPPIRPLFAFLILDSGEYVARLAMDADGRDQVWRSKVGSKTGAPPYYLLVSFSVDTENRIFLDALGKAASMAIELKYIDGETLTRETFSVGREYIQDTQILAQKMYRENSEKCRVVPPLEEVEF
ncbi:MAG TPA: hypothetical protein VJL82_10935 [Rhizomicrobium sp.]|nr:hypothetical protein [Rhizomicrobium sp.]